MARYQRPKDAKVVDFVLHGTTGKRVDIYLNPNDMTFFADVYDDRLEDKDGAALRTKVAAALNEQTVPEWTPIMQVKVKSVTYGSLALELKTERYWLAFRKSGKKPLKASWEALNGDTDHRATTHEEAPWNYERPGETKRFLLPHVARDDYGGKKVYLPYDETLWNQTEILIQALKRMAVMVEKAYTEGTNEDRLSAVQGLVFDLLKVASPEEVGDADDS